MNFYGVKSEYNPKDYTHIIAIAEQSAGNESVGSMWLETKSFKKETSIGKIIEWATENRISGKLIITIDESTVKEKN